MEAIRPNVAIQAVDTTHIPSPNGKKNQLNDLPGFNVNYTARTPREAQEVCAGITDIMLHENLKGRAQGAQSTTAFVARQGEEAKRTIHALDRPLASFKQ